MRHLNNGTDHRHSKSCCDQSSPARRTTSHMTYFTDLYVYTVGCRLSLMSWWPFGWNDTMRLVSDFVHLTWFIQKWIDDIILWHWISCHDDVIKWKHFLRYWPFVQVPSEFPAQRPVTRSFDVFFDLRLNEWFSKQSRGWWFEMLPRSLWRHSNDLHLLTEQVIHVSCTCTPVSKVYYFLSFKLLWS